MTRSVLVLFVAVIMLAACAGQNPSPRPNATQGDAYVPPPPPPPGPDGGYLPPSSDSTVAPPVTSDTGTGTPAGGASCTDIFACFYISQCQQGDTSCFNGCVAAGSPTAQQQYQALGQCESGAVGSSCSMCNSQQLDLSCASCLASSCQQQYTACGMSQTCQQGHGCLQSCPQNDTKCYETCVSKLSIVGLADYIASEQCWDSATKGTCAASCANLQSQQCYTCVDAQCASQFKTCGLIP